MWFQGSLPPPNLCTSSSTHSWFPSGQSILAQKPAFQIPQQAIAIRANSLTSHKPSLQFSTLFFQRSQKVTTTTPGINGWDSSMEQVSNRQLLMEGSPEKEFQFGENWDFHNWHQTSLRRKGSGHSSMGGGAGIGRQPCSPNSPHTTTSASSSGKGISTLRDCNIQYGLIQVLRENLLQKAHIPLSVVMHQVFHPEYILA
ncbi:hypothetical protein PIB30_037136 [Stylosanthes scabra]|uniref:Uncharacterized protein n=1 Tax=Stylosanthes scabra TaxID=79078 RepID=A0ABU6QE65_9FABA|nr:hypothetical protein [Stylosanthes scabra]